MVHLDVGTGPGHQGPVLEVAKFRPRQTKRSASEGLGAVRTPPLGAGNARGKSSSVRWRRRSCRSRRRMMTGQGPQNRLTPEGDEIFKGKSSAECVFEDLAVKQGVFLDVECLVGSDVILSSSTSCLVPSDVFSKVQHKSRCMVAHPVNPPYLVKLVELVPHPETSSSVMDTAHALMTQVGQVPVRLHRELDGFALNRIQMAVIAESWRLVQDGVISVKDVDLVMSEGLGMRYAFIGPMETMHLNAPQGLGDYMQRYGPGIQRVLSSFGPTPDFFSDQAQGIIAEMSELIPPEQLSARIERRDQLLSQLAQLKKDH